MKSIKRIVLPSIFIGAVLLIWAAAFSSRAPRAEAQKESGCNVSNVGGNYAYAAFGTIAAGNPAGFPAGAYSSAAVLKLDGAGNYTITAKTSYNGTIVDEQFADVYQVNDDCRITFLNQGIPYVVAYITNNRSEARGVSTIPGTNVTFLTVRK